MDAFYSHGAPGSRRISFSPEKALPDGNGPLFMLFIRVMEQSVKNAHQRTAHGRIDAQ